MSLLGGYTLSSNEFASSIVSSHNLYVCRYVYMSCCTLLYSGFLNIHIMCAGGDYPSLLGASHLHVSFSLIHEN